MSVTLENAKLSISLDNGQTWVDIKAGAASFTYKDHLEDKVIMESIKRQMVTTINYRASGSWVDFYSAASQSDPSKTYIVARKENGAWGCSCPRWIYKREHCKHIKMVEAYLADPGKLQTIEPGDLSEKERKALSRISGFVIGGELQPGQADSDSERAAFLEL